MGCPYANSTHPSKHAALPKDNKGSGGLARRLLTRFLPARRLVDGGSDRSNHLRGHLEFLHAVGDAVAASDEIEVVVDRPHLAVLVLDDQKPDWPVDAAQ